MAGFLSKGTPGISHFVAAVPAVIWLTAIPLAALAELRHPRIAWALVALIHAVDLYFYFGVYVPGEDHPHLTHDFPADPMPLGRPARVAFGCILPVARRPAPR